MTTLPFSQFTISDLHNLYALGVEFVLDYKRGVVIFKDEKPEESNEPTPAEWILHGEMYESK